MGFQGDPAPEGEVPRVSRALTSAGERSVQQEDSKGRKKKQLLSREFDLLQGRRAFINKGPVSHALLPVLLLPVLSLRLDTHIDAHTHGHTQTHTCGHTHS